MSSNIRVQRICQFCGKEFTARTTVTKYCSDVCAKRAYKARKRTEKVEISNNAIAIISQLNFIGNKLVVFSYFIYQNNFIKKTI